MLLVSGAAAAPVFGNPQSITQSVNVDTIDRDQSLHCNVPGTQTHWWRLFDLDGDHNLTGDFCAESIDYGIESLAGNQTLTIRVRCLAEGLPFDSTNAVIVGTAAVPHTPTSLTLHSAAVSGCCDADTEDMAIQLSTQDIAFFVGCNALGQTAPTYLSASGASDCGIPEPVDIEPSFPGTHFLVLVVHGEGQVGDDDSVPASTDLGVLLLVLALFGSGARLRRRSAAR